MKSGVTDKTTKGYLRITAGPLRNQYLHRIVAAALLGRPLTKDEEIHHRDGNKLNPWFTNLMVLGSMDHGWVSAKQAHFMRTRDAAEEAEWNTFMAEEALTFTASAQSSKAAGIVHAVQDGQLQRRWNERTKL